MVKSVVIWTVNFCMVAWGQGGHLVTVDGIVSRIMSVYYEFSSSIHILQKLGQVFINN